MNQMMKVKMILSALPFVSPMLRNLGFVESGRSLLSFVLSAKFSPMRSCLAGYNNCGREREGFRYGILDLATLLHALMRWKTTIGHSLKGRGWLGTTMWSRRNGVLTLNQGTRRSTLSEPGFGCRDFLLRTLMSES
ncbi:hypothetical protein LINPERHAP2_LOCUS17510 [Linum perenne]